MVMYNRLITKNPSGSYSWCIIEKNDDNQVISVSLAPLDQRSETFPGESQFTRYTESQIPNPLFVVSEINDDIFQEA